MADLFDEYDEPQGTATETPAPPRRPIAPPGQLSYQDYEALCAAGRKLGVPEFRAWMRQTGRLIAKCPRGCLPFCRGWRLEDVGRPERE